MCGLGFVGLLMFVPVGLLLLFVLGLNIWYLTRLARSRLPGLGPRTRTLAGLAIFLALFAAISVLLVTGLRVVTPCPAP